MKQYLKMLPCRLQHNMGSGGRVVERRTVNQGDGGSIPSATISKLRQYHSPHICLCLSEDTLKASGPFYLVSMLNSVYILRFETVLGMANSSEGNA